MKPRGIQAGIDAANAAQAELDRQFQPEPVQEQPQGNVEPIVHEMGMPPVSDVQAQIDALTKQISDLTQQNQTLKGKLDAEGPRNAEEIRKLRDANRALTEQIKEASRPSVNEALERLKEEYEPSVVEDILTLIRSETQPIAEQASQAGQQVGSLYAQSFGQTLQALVPDYSEINVNPAFATFVDKPIPFGDGETYRERLLRKRNANDAYGVAEIFNAFKQTQSKTPPQDANLTYEPGGGRGGGQPNASNQPKIWTGAELEQAYRDMRRMTPEAKVKLQAEIDRVQAEGRYQP